MAERILVLGGTRSGKSAVAERLVASAAAVRYVATVAAGDADAEMRQRIGAHRARRPAAWETVETPRLAWAVESAPAGSAVLIDALGPWLAERMAQLQVWTDDAVAAWDDAASAGRAVILAEAAAMWKAAAAHDGGPVVVVADESGLGVTALGAGPRRWVDLSGEVAQRLATDADRVLLVVAGRPLQLPAAPEEALDADATLRSHGDVMVPAGALDFAVNIHGDSPPPHIREAIESAAESRGRYPDQAPARAAIARRHGREVGEVCVTAGAAEALWLVAAAVRARRAVVVHPTFTEPDAALRHAGIIPRHVLRRAEDSWGLNPSAIPADADLVVLGNPNNPTGALDPADAVAAVCRPGRVTVVDEAFMDFVEDPAASLAARRDLPGLAVVRSVTKLWGLAGVRAGYLLAPPGLVARCAAGRQPWSVGGDALAALEACMSDERYRARTAAAISEARRQLHRRLTGLDGVQVWDGAANFLLVQSPGRNGVPAQLLERGIAVRPSTFPGLGGDFMRIAVRSPDMNARLVSELTAVLEETG
ncbi:MAG TPA: Rv2231c family pyridoxal phosphate-dependent protein CobC [Egibacteraceae bacterium]|nr:Rv2231c family pyridoxal phosphate-dependent protein CobC [Egibacteraceae bacterium]